MNLACYQEQVLDGVLRDFFVEMKSEKPQLKFQQDNAPSHRSKSMMKWFNKSSILLLFHPPSSPDLSPIEPVWQSSKRYYRLFHISPPLFKSYMQPYYLCGICYQLKMLINTLIVCMTVLRLFWPQREVIPDSSSWNLSILY